MAARVCIVAACALMACGRLGFDHGTSEDSSVGAGDYASAVLADQPRLYYRLGDVQGTTVRDSSGNASNAIVGRNLDAQVTMGMPGALAGDPDTATYFQGSGNAGNGSEGWAAFPDAWSMFAGDFTIEL